MEVDVVITEIPQGTPEYTAAVNNAKDPEKPKIGDKMPTHRGAQPLSRWLLHFGGEYVGELFFPHDGNHYTVNLERWRDADPELTYLSIAFHWQDPDKVGTHRSA